MPRLSAVALALLSGGLTALCLPRPGLCPLGWISLAPLFLALDSASTRRAFLTGWAGGFAFHAIAFYWIFSTCRFAGVPISVGILAWSALAAFQGLNWGFIGAVGAFAAKGLRPFWRPWVWAAAWTAVAFATERFTPRPATDLLAFTQWRHLSFLQIGALAGPHGLGFLLVAWNAALAQAWAETEEGREPAWLAPNMALIVALIVGSWGYGVYALARRSVGGPMARVEILQPNIDQYQKWDLKFEDRITANFEDLLAAARTEEPHLIVWPESSLPYWVEEGEPIPEAALWSQKLGSFQAVGAVSRAHGEHYNSLLLIGADGLLKGSYHKRELVPFGEFIPFGFLRRFIGILNQLGGITAGDARQPLMETPTGTAAATICYEAVFPRLARLDASRGARVIINVTNDGWYKDTWGPYQHFYTNMYRAIENRVTVIRAGNTGISGVIDPWGVVTARLDLNKRGRLDAAVPLEDPFPDRSFYTRHGDWLGAACLFLIALLIMSGWRARRGK